MTKKDAMMTAELKITSTARCEKALECFGTSSLTEVLLMGVELQPEGIRSQGHCSNSRLVTVTFVYLKKH